MLERLLAVLAYGAGLMLLATLLASVVVAVARWWHRR